MENTLISHELEEMRNQIGILKDKLEKQNIVNEKHIRNSMKSKASDLNRTIRRTVIGGVFALAYCPFWLILNDFSPAFIAATVIMLVFSLGATIYQNIKLSKVDFSHGNLVEIAASLGRLRKTYINWTRFVAPLLLIPWFGWVLYEAYNTAGDLPVEIFCIAIIVGGIIGGIIGVSINRKVIGKADDILKQIEELQKDASSLV